MYKIVEELVPTLPTEQFIKFQKQKCQISTNKYQDCETSNILEKRMCNNSKSLVIPDSRTQQYKNSSFLSNNNN